MFKVHIIVVTKQSFVAHEFMIVLKVTKINAFYEEVRVVLLKQS